jgi:hypothetical protein
VLLIHRNRVGRGWAERWIGSGDQRLAHCYLRGQTYYRAGDARLAKRLDGDVDVARVRGEERAKDDEDLAGPMSRGMTR